jgi:NADPH-dependent 2,4-dienoyl-CoA reductase/sulfur reductase-like enzyme
MKTYKYIIVGGGMTGFSAVKGIRENDAEGSLAMFTKEPFIPYDRPPLTKGLWDDNDIEKIKHPLEQYHVDLYLETAVESILPELKQVKTDSGEEFGYDKVLIATGGDPIHLPDAPEEVIYYRTRSDFHQLQQLTEQKTDFCIIGGGFIGSELAAALVKKGKQVTMIFPEHGISGAFFPKDLSVFMVNYYEEQGVNVLNNKLVDSIKKDGSVITVNYHDINDNQAAQASIDVVIAGIGIRPNTKLAEKAGIPTENGILVNPFLETNYPDVFAAGDVANFIMQPLGERMRVEHEDNAKAMGFRAGQNMSGELQPYNHFPFFYSDLFDFGYEGVGEMRADMEIYEDWLEPFQKGTIFYLKDDHIRGLLFWNLWDKVDEGREIIRSGKSYQKNQLKGMFK